MQKKEGDWAPFGMHVDSRTLKIVDLVYPANPALNQKKRTETVTQVQLAFQKGEKLCADNCRFVSRVKFIMNLFRDPDINKAGAQLIVTTHETGLETDPIGLLKAMEKVRKLRIIK